CFLRTTSSPGSKRRNYVMKFPLRP
ncbi:uncharacterized protein METZ01_LOCUS247693, partial [marine metagenome]